MSEITSAVTVKNLRDHFQISGRVVIAAFDATKNRSELEFRTTFETLKSKEDVLHSGDTLVFLGVLHKIQHPLGYQMRATTGDYLGTTQIRVVEEEVSNKVDLYVKLLQPFAQECEDEGINIKVKISAGTPTRKVILQELVQSGATWLVLDRHLTRDSKYYLEKIPCKIAFVNKDLSMEVVRPYNIEKSENIYYELLFSMSKSVETEKNDSSSSSMASIESCNNIDVTSTLLPQLQSSPSDHTLLSPNQTSISTNQETSGKLKKEKKNTTFFKHSPKKLMIQRSPSETPIYCTGCGIKTDTNIKNSTSFKYSEIRLATDEFSKANLLGEGGYGHVYKGKLKNGQLIAAKMRKEASFQGFAEFHSEIHVLSLTRHVNIVMLLGYCVKEKLNILVYEYICNKSLEWHLFDNIESGNLEWHRRYDIAIGIAKGLRYLHEECHESPIIHRDMRPSNILLTHDFVPVIGDFGLAKWRTCEDNVQTTILGTLGYLSPEYAENGIASVKTDVYSFGIVLIQLISGRKVVFDSIKDGHQQSLRQWAIPLIQKLELEEIIDDRIQESYNKFQLHNMAKTAYFCVHTTPHMRPSMGQVLRLLEGDDAQLAEQFVIM